MNNEQSKPKTSRERFEDWWYETGGGELLKESMWDCWQEAERQAKEQQA